jgi:hypothetical protein
MQMEQQISGGSLPIWAASTPTGLGGGGGPKKSKKKPGAKKQAPPAKKK